jgi:hypothetical protein
MPDAQASLTAARADLGYTESPAGSNRTKYGQWYGADGQPWCDMAQSYWADRAGNAAVVGRFSYTPSHAAWFQSKGQWHTGRDVAEGDLVFYNFGAGRIHHVGIVEAVRADGIVTIEGNTSSGNDANGGQVQRRFRAWTVGIVGFGRPAYGSGGFGTMDDAAIKDEFKNVTTRDKAISDASTKEITDAIDKAAVLLHDQSKSQNEAARKRDAAILKAIEDQTAATRDLSAVVTALAKK